MAHILLRLKESHDCRWLLHLRYLPTMTKTSAPMTSNAGRRGSVNSAVLHLHADHGLVNSDFPGGQLHKGQTENK